MRMTLKALRVNAGFTQAEVAKEMKVSTRTIWQWENGKSYPKPEQINMLCRLYGTSYEQIIFLPSKTL